MAVTHDELMDLFAEEALVDRSKLTRDASLAELGIASLDLISVIFAIEERFGLALEDDELPADTNLGGVIDYILARLNQTSVEVQESV